MKILIAGGSGLVGSYLTPNFLEKGYSVTILSRKERASQNNICFTRWDGRRIPDSVGPHDVVINLSGSGILDQKWTSDYKKKLLESRTHSNRACVEFIKKQNLKPKVFIAASAVGFYGTKLKEPATESTPVGNDFIGTLCFEVEKSAHGSGVRTVIPRIGLILAGKGGAFPRLLTPFKYYAGSYLGNGMQPFPWIHIDDIVAGFNFFIENTTIEGPVNLVAPEQINNKSLAKIIGKLTHKPSGIAVPSLAIKLMMGESSYLLLEGQYVHPEKLLDSKFEFKYSKAETAVLDLLKYFS